MSQHNVQVCGNPHEWWNEEVSKLFLSYHFGTRAGMGDDPVLLLRDDLSSHWTPEVQTHATALNVI
ncbi:TPA: hypothetical protein N0F65_010079 [Lagenidium giganteum]|uniref:DDE-1 domain-containing protein n=1 Tax=Lagenidium giganteum TaxID=4803 RepID=A0AAV2ZAN7_9STRA|nr:TPA: hypothetical protein N0F65_010079 [Lagenidium giganteum]